MKSGSSGLTNRGGRRPCDVREACHLRPVSGAALVAFAPVRAELRGLYTPDCPDPDLANYHPEDGEYFSLMVGAFIGPDEPPLGEELFDFHVCTAAWLADHPPQKGFEFLKNTILLTRWDYAVLTRAIGDLCRHTSGADWREIANRLSRYGRWEHEV